MTAYNRSPYITCPHCGARGALRSSEQVTALVREARVICNDEECGHAFVVQISAIRTVRPSGKPNPGVYLPQGGWTMPANDPDPRPANDDKPPAAREAAPSPG